MSFSNIWLLFILFRLVVTYSSFNKLISTTFTETVATECVSAFCVHNKWLQNFAVYADKWEESLDVYAAYHQGIVGSSA